MIKRLSSIILVLVLLLGLALPAFAADMQEGSMYVNTANGRALRFRSEKNTNSDNILAEIPYGTKVYVLDWDSTWAKVRYNGAVGYVVKKFLTIARPKDYETVVAEREAAKIAAAEAKRLAAEAAKAQKEADAAAKKAAQEAAKAQKEAEAAAKKAAREAEKAQKEAERLEKEAEKERLKALKEENAKLDQTKIQTIDEYDVTVRVGVVDLAVNLYSKPDLTSDVLAEYMDGVRLLVRAANADWALVYNGENDDVGYMLLTDLEPDVMEEEILDD